jgi:transposase-like protein
MPGGWRAEGVAPGSIRCPTCGHFRRIGERPAHHTQPKMHKCAETRPRQDSYFLNDINML